MNKTKVWCAAEARNFEKLENGVRWEAVIFSSEFNRNKSYFDIYKLRRWQDKTEKILFNNSHKGKYFGRATDRLKELVIKTDDQGITEAYGVIESNHPEKIENPEMVTGFSIELLIDEKDVIANENGEYYIDYEFVGIAYLLGDLQGSGDSRILSVRTFAEAKQSNSNIMDEKQLKTLLEEQKEAFKAEINAKFESIVSQQSTKTMGSVSWKTEDGKTMTESWEQIYKSIVTESETDEVTPEMIAEYFYKKGVKFEVETQDKPEEKEVEEQAQDEGQTEKQPETEQKTVEAVGESQAEDQPKADADQTEDPELTKIENSINRAKSTRKTFNNLPKEEELIENRGSDNAAKSISKPTLTGKEFLKRILS